MIVKITYNPVSLAAQVLTAITLYFNTFSEIEVDTVFKPAGLITCGKNGSPRRPRIL